MAVIEVRNIDRPTHGRAKLVAPQFAMAAGYVKVIAAVKKIVTHKLKYRSVQRIAALLDHKIDDRSCNTAVLR